MTGDEGVELCEQSAGTLPLTIPTWDVHGSDRNFLIVSKLGYNLFRRRNQPNLYLGLGHPVTK